VPASSHSIAIINNKLNKSLHYLHIGFFARTALKDMG
jgi:hypothetical protein